jgi:DeoR family glycerol-3-phosphate regulon repressor
MNMMSRISADFPPSSSLLAEDRGRAIVERVRAQGFQAIEALAAEFGVTAQTIRRDVNLLCDRGLLRRRHGGVELPPEGENLAYPARQVLNIEAKQRIARLVAEEVPDGASLFIGIGTTPEQCTRALTERRNLRVMTNNLNAALALSHNPTCEITIAGGRLRSLDCDVVAGEAHDFFARFAADIGIYGAGGVTEEGELLDFSADEVTMRQTLAQHCRQRFLVLDRSKFGRAATVRGGSIAEATAVFTDGPVPAPVAALLNERGVRLVICPESTPSVTTPDQRRR